MVFEERNRGDDMCSARTEALRTNSIKFSIDKTVESPIECVNKNMKVPSI